MSHLAIQRKYRQEKSTYKIWSYSAWEEINFLGWNLLIFEITYTLSADVFIKPVSSLG